MRSSWSHDVRRREPRPRNDVRASDAEREEVVEQLSRHTGDGRLTLDEFEQRVEDAFNAKTRRDLDATLRGLPTTSTRVRRRPDITAPLRPLVAIALVALAVVALGAWVLWIAIPVAWCRLGGARRHHWREVEAGRDEADDLTLV